MTFETPGNFTEEIGRAPTIAGVPTSTCAFVGHAADGPAHQPTAVASFDEFVARFGAPQGGSPLADAVDLFFRNGGRGALIVRLPQPAMDAATLIGTGDTTPRGLACLEDSARFGLLVVPEVTRLDETGRRAVLDDTAMAAVWRAALDLCRRRGGFLLVDAPGDAVDLAALREWRATRVAEADPFGACYTPWLTVAGADQAGARAVAPAGAVAGLYVRMDAERGVWRAPAGVGAQLNGVVGPAADFTDAEQAPLNALGVNLIRRFPGTGTVAWGARTLAGADALASEWKYVPVRRTASWIEASLHEGLSWAVFEANDEPLWARLRLAASGFLDGLFRQDAFAGRSVRDAYFVRCDRTTMDQGDIDHGRVSLLVGFAPLKPAEFVVIRIGLMARVP